MVSKFLWHYGIQHMSSCPGPPKGLRHEDASVLSASLLINAQPRRSSTLSSAKVTEPLGIYTACLSWVRAALQNTDVFLLILFALCSGHTRSYLAAGNPSKTDPAREMASDLGLVPASPRCWAQLIHLKRMAYEGGDEHINTSFF